MNASEEDKQRRIYYQNEEQKKKKTKEKKNEANKIDLKNTLVSVCMHLLMHNYCI